MVGVIDPTRKYELVQRAASVFEPGQNAAAGGFEEFEHFLMKTLKRVSAEMALHVLAYTSRAS
jgi:hypothetical protein